jgi:hypothetical protein
MVDPVSLIILEPGIVVSPEVGSPSSPAASNHGVTVLGEDHPMGPGWQHTRDNSGESFEIEIKGVHRRKVGPVFHEVFRSET